MSSHYLLDDPRIIVVVVVYFTYTTLNSYLPKQIPCRDLQMSRDMTKPTKWLCAQRRLRSAFACAQSDQSSLSAWRKLGSLAPIERTAKTLIRLGGCPGWSEPSLGAHLFCCFFHVVGQICMVSLINSYCQSARIVLGVVSSIIRNSSSCWKDNCYIISGHLNDKSSDRIVSTSLLKW